MYLSLKIEAESLSWTQDQLSILRQGHLFEKGPDVTARQETRFSDWRRA